MLTLKPLTLQAVPRALDKAERYRLLNDPVEAQSICEDVLQVDPQNQSALILLTLALTDQIGEGIGGILAQVHEVISRLSDSYDVAYYSGIAAEREGKARLRAGSVGANMTAGECLREAMHFFEQAEALRPPGNDDALLRWNACARLLMRLPQPAEGEVFMPLLE